jgi:hypothetical protein
VYSRRIVCDSAYSSDLNVHSLQTTDLTFSKLRKYFYLYVVKYSLRPFLKIKFEAHDELHIIL